MWVLGIDKKLHPHVTTDAIINIDEQLLKLEHEGGDLSNGKYGILLLFYVLIS